MKKIILLSILFTASICAQSFDTLKVKTVASGVTHYHIVEPGVPWNLNVLEIDLQDPYLEMISAKGNNKLAGKERLSSLVESNTDDVNKVIGAINADFFDGDGVPVGIQVLDGEILTSHVARDWSKIGFSSENMPFISRPYFSGELIANDNTFDLYGINRDRGTDKLVLYNGYKNSTTGTNQWGTEVIIEPLDGWIVNDTLDFMVKEIEQGVGDRLIERPSVILSGHGLAKTFLEENISTGDTISLVVELLPGIEKIKELVSGFPQIVKDGTNYALEGYEEEGGSSTFATDRHPRTGAGYSEDKSKLYLVVVDGRQFNLSRGMSLPELADFMIGIGVYTGLNLDGGGSSEMIVKGEIVNSPSDGGERPISNALLVRSSEPAVFSELELIPDTVVTDLNNPIQFIVKGIDLYGNEINNDFSAVDLSVITPSVGSTNETGLFTPESDGTTVLEAMSGEALDHSNISVESYSGESLLHSFEQLSDIKLSGEAIDTVSTTMQLNHELKTHGEASVELDYSFTYYPSNINWLYLNMDIPIDGIPESISIDVNPDRTDHSYAFVITDENGEEYALLMETGAGEISAFNTLTADFENPVHLNTGQNFFFPVRLKQVAVVLGSDRSTGLLYSGKFYLDHIRINYPEPSSTGGSDRPLANEYVLNQNYPNPFNPETIIEYSLPVSSKEYVVGGSQNRISGVENQRQVSLKIYDILGREVAVLVNQNQGPGNYSVTFNAADLPSGIYIYRLTAGSITISKKLTLLK